MGSYRRYSLHQCFQRHIDPHADPLLHVFPIHQNYHQLSLQSSHINKYKNLMNMFCFLGGYNYTNQLTGRTTAPPPVDTTIRCIMDSLFNASVC